MKVSLTPTAQKAIAEFYEWNSLSFVQLTFNPNGSQTVQLEELFS